MIQIYKISIIIPVYNLEDLIERAFNSIFNQTIGFENLEVIFVDDCSTDSSKEKILEFSKYDNVKGIFLDKNSGFGGKPRNVGLQHASADYIMFLDADDLYLENTCELLYDKIVSENVDLVSGNFAINTLDNVVRWNHIDLLDEIKINSIEEKPSLFVLSPAIWSKIYKKDLIVNNTIFFDENLPGQDALFTYKILRYAKGMIFINTPLVIYCNRDYNTIKERSVTDNLSFKKLWSYLLIYEKMYNVLHEYNPKYEIVLYTHLSFWSNLLNKTKLNIKERINLFDKFNEIIKKINVEINDKELLSVYRTAKTNIVHNTLLRKKDSNYIQNILNNIQYDSIDLINELKSIEKFMNDNKLYKFKYDFLLFKILTIVDILDSVKYAKSFVLIPESERKKVHKSKYHLDYSKYYGSNSKYIGFSYEYSEEIFSIIKEYLNKNTIDYHDIIYLDNNYNIKHEIYKLSCVLLYDSYEDYHKNCSTLIIEELTNKKNIFDLENTYIKKEIDNNKLISNRQTHLIDDSLKLLSSEKLHVKELDYEYDNLKKDNLELISKVEKIRLDNNQIQKSNIWNIGLKLKSLKENFFKTFT